MTWRADYKGEMLGRCPTRGEAQELAKGALFATVTNVETGERWILRGNGSGWQITVPVKRAALAEPDPEKWPPVKPRADLDN